MDPTPQNETPTPETPTASVSPTKKSRQKKPRTTSVDPTISPAKRAKKQQWWEPFRAEIIEYCIKPRLYELLQIGVNDKKELLDQWNEATGCGVTMATLDEWLTLSGLSNVFQAAKKFRIEPFQYQQPQPETPYYPEPQQQAPYPPPPVMAQAPAPQVPPGAMRRPIPRIPNHDPDEQALMAQGITPIVPGLSRRPSGPPTRTSTNHGGRQVPMDTIELPHSAFQ